MSSSPFGLRHFEQRLAGDADQAEFEAVLTGEAAIDAALYDDVVAGALDDFEQPKDDAIGLDWHQGDLARESGVGKVHEEIDRRRQIMGASYPFSLNGNTIVYRPTGTAVYEFCLAASMLDTLSAKPEVFLVRAFERVSAVLVAEFVGHPNQVFHTGAPRLHGLPARFDDAMKQVASATGEWEWNPRRFYPDEHASTGDEGLDFIVSKRPGDRRAGQLFVIGQCACGDDWNTKWRELSLEKLAKWFHPVSVVPPVRAFATPHLLSAGNLLDAQAEAGLVFDRARLAILAASCGLESALTGWAEELRRLSSLVIRTVGSPPTVYRPSFEIASIADHSSAAVFVVGN